jgi:hypothetical protein
METNYQKCQRKKAIKRINENRKVFHGGNELFYE